MSIEGKEKEKRLDCESLECGFVGSDGVAPTGLGDGRPGAFLRWSSLGECWAYRDLCVDCKGCRWQHYCLQRTR